jgi:hypothetical protein
MIFGINLLQLFGLLTASFLTLVVLSYAVGDNQLFRLVIHVFIGVTAGYVAAVAIHNVLVPQFVEMGANVFQNPLLLLFVIISIALLVTKISPRTAQFGNPVSALLVGAGAAIAIGGAIRGTLLPQIGAATAFFNPPELRVALEQSQYGSVLGLMLQGSIILIGTLTALISFHFGARSAKNEIPQRSPYIERIAQVGRVFVAITLGVVFAGVFSAALTALVERFDFLMDVLDTLWRWVSGI